MIPHVPFSVFLSLKYLRGRHQHRWISLINAFSVGGIALGVMALIVVLSVMGGFDLDLKKRILGVYAPITIGGNTSIDDHQEILQKLKSMPEIKGASPFVSGQLLAQIRDRVYGVFVRGIDPELEKTATHVQEYLIEGHMDFGTARDQGVVIGNELARQFHLKVGDSIDLLSPVSVPTPLGLSSHTLTFEVIGIFDSGMYEYDLNLIYVSLQSGQELYALGNAVTGITVNVEDLDGVFETKQAIKEVLDPKVMVRTWIEMNRNLFRAILTEKWIMFWILLLIVLVAAFNIASSLIMMVMEKTKEIGILKALGTNRGCILRVFLLQGFMIGGVGTLLGYIGGIVLTLNLNPIANAVARWTGFEFFPKDVYYLDKIPTLLNFEQSALVAFSALVLSLLAAFYPAFQASRMTAVEAIRYE